MTSNHYEKATHLHMVYDDKRSARVFAYFAKNPAGAANPLRDFVEFEASLTIEDIVDRGVRLGHQGGAK
jgi:hypothetical protein